MDSWIVRGDGFGVSDVRCTAPRSGFDAPEEGGGHVLVAVRRGAFVRKVRGGEQLLDSTVAYLGEPGTVQQFAHPVAGGDACTAIDLRPALLAGLCGGDPSVSVATLPVDGRAELALRLVTELARRGEDPHGVLAEHVVRLVATLLARRMPERVVSGRPATVAARRRLVDDAREQLLADPTPGLVELSRRVASSPHHLSRTFTAATGLSVSRYRNRLRVGRALDRIGQGESDLALLAAELGFADHAHLTRTMRDLAGYTPQGWRRLVAAKCSV